VEGRYEPIGRLLIATAEVRVEQACRQLLTGMALETVNEGLNGLLQGGVIDDRIATRLGLEFITGLGAKTPETRQATPPAVSAPEVAALGDGEAASADEDAALKIVECTARAETEEQDDAENDEPNRCPVCGIRISASAVGCRAHWRQVKAGMDE